MRQNPQPKTTRAELRNRQPERNVAKKGIGSVEIAVRILRAIEDSSTPLSLTQIARAVGFQLSKTHHYLVSMVRTGLVSQEPERGLYTLGRYALQLGLSALSRTEASSVTAHAVRTLRDETGHTTCFSLWGDRGPVVVHSEQGLRPLTVHIRIGTVLPIWGSATSDAFFAWMPDAVVAPVLYESRRSIRARDIAEIKARIRRDGIAHQSNTRTPNVAALAAPVFSGSRAGTLAGVLTSIGFLGELDDNPQSKDARVLRQHAKNLSQALRFQAVPSGHLT